MTTFWQTFETKEQQHFTRFLTVGISGTLLDFCLLTLLKTLGFATLPANSLAFSAGILNNFIWNRRWTFANAQQANWRKQFLQFALVSLIGLMLNNAIVFVLETPVAQLFAQPTYGYLPAKIIATGIVVFWNYFANRHWTFKH